MKKWMHWMVGAIVGVVLSASSAMAGVTDEDPGSITPPPPPPPPPAKKKVFLSGSRFFTGYSVGDYMKTYTASVVNAEGSNVRQQIASQGTADQLAAFDAFRAKIDAFPATAQVFGVLQQAPKTSIVDEIGNILGTINTNSIFDTGLPGMSNLGNPWGNGNFNRVWMGPGSLSFGGEELEVVAFVSVSPIVIDLDGSGKPHVDRGDWRPHPERFNMKWAKKFDINGDGDADLTEWLGSDDGLLVAPSEELKVVGGRQLFGTAVGYVDGYQKLGLLRDKNKDGVVSGDELQGLQVWQDKNNDGICQPEELRTVQDIGLTSLRVNHDNFKSSCVINGKQHQTWDWWPTVMIVRPAAVR